MTSGERFREICESRGIAIGRVEKDLGYSNNSLRTVKTLPSDRLFAVAEYLGISPRFLAIGEEEKTATTNGDGLEMERDSWTTAWQSATPEARAAALSVLRLGAQSREVRDGSPSET